MTTQPHKTLEPMSNTKTPEIIKQEFAGDDIEVRIADRTAYLIQDKRTIWIEDANRKAAALMICPELAQQNRAYVEALKSFIDVDRSNDTEFHLCRIKAIQLIQNEGK